MNDNSNLEKNISGIVDGFKGKRLFVKLWFIFSVPFIVYVLWQSLQETQFARGVQIGSERASELIYNDIINKAANETCNSIFVERSGRRVDLINVQCLNITKNSEDNNIANNEEINNVTNNAEDNSITNKTDSVEEDKI